MQDIIGHKPWQNSSTLRRQLNTFFNLQKLMKMRDICILFLHCTVWNPPSTHLYLENKYKHTNMSLKRLLLYMQIEKSIQLPSLSYEILSWFVANSVLYLFRSPPTLDKSLDFVIPFDNTLQSMYLNNAVSVSN